MPPFAKAGHICNKS